MDIGTRTRRGYRYKKKRWTLLQGQEGVSMQGEEVNIVTRRRCRNQYKVKRWTLLQGQEGDIDTKRRGGHCYKDKRGHRYKEKR